MVVFFLLFYFECKWRGLLIDMVLLFFEIIGEDEVDDDFEVNSKWVYWWLVFDLSGNVLKEFLFEEVLMNCFFWVKIKLWYKCWLYCGL